MNNSTEAPASANTRVQLPSGRQYQITMRTEKMGDLLEQISMLEDKFNELGWDVPSWQKDKPGSEPAWIKDEDLGNCDKCGAPNLRSKKGNTYCSKRCWL